MAVDFLVLGPTIGNAFVSMKQAIRPLGAHKVAWIARKHGYNALAISKLHLLSEDDIVEICSKFIGPKTLIGISTSLIAVPSDGPPRQANTDFTVLEIFTRAVARLKALYNNKIIIGGQVAHKYVKWFNAEYHIDGLSVENDVVKFLDQHFRNGIQRKPYDWDITSCDFMWHETDFIQPKEALPMETSRGCIFKCKFCTYSEIGRKKGTFEKDINHLKNYIVENYEKYGVTQYTLADDTFNDDDDRMNEWCDMLETLPFKIKYGGYVRLDLFERYQETAKRLYKNGLRGCSFGLETFHPGAAKVIGKSFSATKGKKFLLKYWEEIAEKNMFIICTNIVGLPGESLESVEQTFQWYKDKTDFMQLWSPLCISKNPDRWVSQTVFGSNPEQYGYEFLSEAEWKNEHMTFSDATQKVYEFMRRSMNGVNHPIDCWSQFSFFSVNNMEPKEYFALSLEDRTKLRDDLQKDVDKINQGYFKALREYGDKQ